jgi:hypothetical protein
MSVNVMTQSILRRADCETPMCVRSLPRGMLTEIHIKRAAAHLTNVYKTYREKEYVCGVSAALEIGLHRN